MSTNIPSPHSTGALAIGEQEATGNAMLAAAAPELLALLLEAVEGHEMETRLAQQIDADYLKATGKHLFIDPATNEPAFGMKSQPRRGYLRLLRRETGDFAAEPIADPADAIEEPEHAMPWYRGED